MGDHRASIKIEMEFHGIKKNIDMWINYWPQECCQMDKRVVEFFQEVYELGMEKYDGMIYESQEKERKAAEEIRDRQEYDRLKTKFEKS